MFGQVRTAVRDGSQDEVLLIYGETLPEPQQILFCFGVKSTELHLKPRFFMFTHFADVPTCKQTCGLSKKMLIHFAAAAFYSSLKQNISASC